eukprot:1151148-Pelagomonas_calceolata.AAC.2
MALTIQVEIVYVYGKAIDEHETCACRNELLRFCHGTAEAAVHLRMTVRMLLHDCIIFQGPRLQKNTADPA